MVTPAARTAAGALALIIVLAGCSSGGSPGARAPAGGTGGRSALPAPSIAGGPTPVPAPTSPGAPPGGEQPANPGFGGIVPIAPGDGAVGGGPQPTLVTPVAGLLNVHPVTVVDLQPSVAGRDVTVRASWWSGVEPCNVLAGVDIAHDGSTITLTVQEGAARLDIACIEIAVYKATIVDLGTLDPGSYTIAAHGEAAPVTVTVTG